MTEISDEMVEAAAEAGFQESLKMCGGFTSRKLSVNGLSVGNYRIMRAALAAAEAVRSKTHVVVEPQSPAEAIHKWWANQRGSAEIPQALIDLYRQGQLRLRASGGNRDGR